MKAMVSSKGLRPAAKKLGITLTALSEKLGVNKTTLSGWIAKGRMPADKAEALAALVGGGKNLPAIIDAEFAPAPRRRSATVVCHPTAEQLPLLKALLAALGVSHEA